MYFICYKWVLITTRYCRRSLHLASSFDSRKSGSRVLIYEGQKQIQNSSFTWNTIMESRDIQIVDTWDSSMLTTAIPRMRLIQFCVNKMNLPFFSKKTPFNSTLHETSEIPVDNIINFRKLIMKIFLILGNKIFKRMYVYIYDSFLFWNVYTKNTLTQASKTGRKPSLFPQKKFVRVFYAINIFITIYYFKPTNFNCA